MSEHTSIEWASAAEAGDPDAAVATARREIDQWRTTAEALARELRAGRQPGQPTVSAALRRYDAATAAARGRGQRGH